MLPHVAAPGAAQQLTSASNAVACRDTKSSTSRCTVPSPQVLAWPQCLWVLPAGHTSDMQELAAHACSRSPPRLCPAEGATPRLRCLRVVFWPQCLLLPAHRCVAQHMLAACRDHVWLPGPHPDPSSACWAPALACTSSQSACPEHAVCPAGHTNNFHIQTQTPLAQRYNDISVMENHHCAITFAILAKRDCAILEHLERPRRQVISLEHIDRTKGATPSSLGQGAKPALLYKAGLWVEPTQPLLQTGSGVSF